MIGQRILQHKTSHTGLAAIHQILMDSPEALLAIVIVRINHNERCVENLLRCKHSLSGSPRLRSSFRQNPRDIVNILKSIIHGYIMRRANGGNAITDHLFKFLLNLLADNKYHMVEACLNGIMDGIVYDNMTSIIDRLQLFDSCSKAAADTSSHDK